MLATMESSTTATPEADRVRRFLEALGRRDFDELRALLASNVWFRTLLPRKLAETSTREDAVAALQEWFGKAADFKVLETDHYTMEGREFLKYRFLLRPVWAPDQWHVIEQAGYCRVKDGFITRIDLVCTGFFPVGDDARRRKK